MSASSPAPLSRPRIVNAAFWCWLAAAILLIAGGLLTATVNLAGLPGIYLTVRGRKSGIERTSPLMCVPDGDTWLIAGSYFGGPKTPLWVGNLRAAAGRATVEFGKETFAVTATELTGADRAAAWRTMLEVWPNYAKYEERTDRTIPVFRLTREG